MNEQQIEDVAGQEEVYTCIANDVHEEICQTCGKWTIHNDNHCYGCKRPVEKCCC